MKRQFSIDYSQNASKRQKKPTPTRSAARVTKAAITKVLRSVAEQKYRQNSTGNAEIIVNASTAPYFVDFPVPTVGDTVHERNGNKIHARAIESRFTLFNNGTGDNNVFVRVLVLRVDAGRYQTNSAIEADLFEGTAGGTDTTFYADNQDLCAKVNREGLKVLKDEVIDLSAKGNSSSLGYPASAFRHYYMGVNQTLYFMEASTADAVNIRYVICFIPRQASNDDALTGLELVNMNGMYYTDI